MDNGALQVGYYARALATINGGGVVFAHGMANTVLAAACATQGLCTVRWYGLGAMFRGTSVATVALSKDLPFAPTTLASLDPSTPVWLTVRWPGP